MHPNQGQQADGRTLGDETSVSMDTDLDATVRTIVEGAAAASVPQQTLGVGSKLGKYEIRQLLGRGGMGTVYLGYDTVLEREVAIKVLPPEVEARPNTLKRFLAEARATGKLNHPHVVAIYDLGDANGLHYFVMEVLRGGSLADVIDRRKTLPWKEACELIAQAADGLAAAHAVGLVHRDIKPENLMFTAEGVVKVVDFGVSKLIDEESSMHMTAAGQLLGTPHYMSPEQVRATEIDARSDIYNLGAAFFRALTGRYPFEDCKAVTQVLLAHLDRPIPSASAMLPDVPAGCDKILSRAMAKRADARYQTATEFAKALRDLVSSDCGEAATIQAPAPAKVYRPLQDVAIIEPSKVQAMLLERACRRAGATSIRSFSKLTGTLEALEVNPPDLLITAQQLSDGVGLDAIERARQISSLTEIPVLLTSADLTFEEVVQASDHGWVGLASKKTRPEEILAGVEAGSFLSMPYSRLESVRNPATLSLLLRCENGLVPLSVADLLRALGLFNVHVSDLTNVPDMTGANSFDLTLILPGKPLTRAEAAQTAHDAWKVLSQRTTVLAVAGADAAGKKLVLQAVTRGGFSSVMNSPLDGERLRTLLCSCIAVD